ncbi:hypothetical protein MUCCIDRAFT_110830 [Mucor lusitanicus CBS 277.49]|uniref:Retrotransposon gag domain-containing protein n=1 Tax=Mucor lusitanicus CBS 277.49 TaxID=747725 RepID=A0A162RBI8_MUCCL|nr:hypothetical protein MUCCIDRAFT_110830 [Mucor lusitanicus CBS 277.49]
MAGTEQGNNSSTVNNSNILKIAEILKEVILAKTRRTILILLRSPRSLMGLGIPMSLTFGYSQLKIISGLSSDMIMNNFANLPENTVSIARDKLRALKQTSTIAAYVQQFIMTTKLSIPKMTDDEAVDKFLAGLKDPDARIYVKMMT